MANNIIIEFKLKIPEAERFFAERMNEFLTVAGELVLEKAQDNVKPGKGPGPHPHKQYPGWPEHEDTGQLEDSLMTYGPYEEGNNVKAIEIGGDGSVDYGKYLEAGWVDPRTGTFWQYPYLVPALNTEWGRVMRELRGMLGEGAPPALRVR